MNNAQRAENVARGLRDLMLLRRTSDQGDDRLMYDGLRVLHEAEATYFDVPRIALCFSMAKHRMLHDAVQGVRPGVSVRTATDFLKAWLPRLPDKEKAIILDPEKPLAAEDLPRRTPQTAPGATQLRKAAAPIPPEMDQKFAARTVETLEYTLQALQKWNVPADSQSPSL